MKFTGALLLAMLLAPAFPTAAAAEDGSLVLGHMLSLVQVFVRLAAQDDPAASLKAIDDVLAGRNLEANRAVAGLFNQMAAGMPSEHRDKVASIASDVLSLARRDLNKPATSSLLTEQSLQARKDLAAMGLRYFDAKDYLDAVRRDDTLAVELFIAGRGVNLASRDADGRSAADIARANGNAHLAELLARSLSASR